MEADEGRIDPRACEHLPEGLLPADSRLLACKAGRGETLIALIIAPTRLVAFAGRLDAGAASLHTLSFYRSAVSVSGS
jgi:hypothetical protein